MRPKPMVLVILDGWGVREERHGNAIYHAATPHFDGWWRSRPHALVQTSEEHVGLPEGQMGNSEVGHTNLGAGRVVSQDLTRIDRAIRDGRLGDNEAVRRLLHQTVVHRGVLHLCGLFSPGGVHAHTAHLLAAVHVAQQQGVQQIALHAILDGRDTPPRSALGYVATVQEALQRFGVGRIVSVCGRYYAMDRDKRWDRVQKAYDMMTRGVGHRASDPLSAIQAGYDRGEDDEFIQPTLIVGEDASVTCLEDGDAVWMVNFRADRMREICHALRDPSQGQNAFQGFVRQRQPKLASLLTMTQYDAGLPAVEVAFPPEPLTQILGEVLSQHGLRQLRAAETEKYAHVTYFFNGGQELLFPGEERLLVPSPKVATYDVQPSMAAEHLTDCLLAWLAQDARMPDGGVDLVVVNYANADMVGHTGRWDAAVEAVEVVDRCLGRLAEVVLSMGGELLITADHGNADCMIEHATGQPHTAHTLSAAPLLYLGRSATIRDGRLCDIAPTLLALMDLPQPTQMTGASLIAVNV